MDIVEYMLNGDGSRRRSFKVGEFTVFVEPHQDDAGARALAEDLSTARERIAHLEAECSRLRRSVPPKRPARLLGPGCVRMRGGELWLLGNRAKGWGSFGVLLGGWDDLFRRYAVRVTDHGDDDHGAYWTVENEGAA